MMLGALKQLQLLFFCRNSQLSACCSPPISKSAPKGTKSQAREAVLGDRTTPHDWQWLRFGFCSMWVEEGPKLSLMCGSYKSHGSV